MSADLTLVSLSGDAVTGDRVMPLGALHVAVAVEHAGFAVDLRDAQCSSLPLADLLETDAPVLGLSLMSDRLPEALDALVSFRARRPEALVVLGGPGPSEVAAPLLRAFPAVDAVARGEGEGTAVDLLAAFRSGGRGALRGIAGLSVRLGDEVVHGPTRPRLTRLDGHGWPAGCRWDLSPYRDAALVSARGCPFRCGYCSIVGLWGRKMAFQTPAAVAAEVAWLAARKPGAFVHFEDDTFTADPRRARTICDAVAPLGVSWGCTARIDQLDPDLADRMADSGCRSLFLGIESGSDRLRASQHKAFTTARVFARMERLVERFAVTAHYVWGFPGETMDELVETFLHVGALTALGAAPRHSHLLPFPAAPVTRRVLGDPPEPREALRDGRLRLLEALPFPRLFQLRPEAPWAELVRAHPEVFLPYYLLQTQDWEEKSAFVAAYGRFERAC